MAKSAKPKRNNRRQTAINTDKYFKPTKPNESVEGKFIGMYAGAFNDNLVLETSTGEEKVVALSTVLRNKLKHKEQYKLLKPNTKVKIVYLGEGKGKKGRKSKLYDIYINGKILADNMGSIESKNLESFFSK